MLVDAGFRELSARMGGAAGRLAGELRALGVEPADIDAVILTHAHAHHIRGVMTGGEPTFAGARHHLPRVEHDSGSGRLRRNASSRRSPTPWS